MSDELVKRTYHRGARDFGTGYDMMARIVELEAALAKADALLKDVSLYFEDDQSISASIRAYLESRNLYV